MASKLPPDSFYRSVTPADRAATASAREANTLRTNWSAAGDLKGWAKQQGWPAPWLNFEAKFFETLLANDANFALAIANSGLKLSIPLAEYTMTANELQKLDVEYEDPQSWRWLVESLREIRRAVEAGVVVHVEEQTLTDFNSFYSWAHGRFHMLEDGADEWIGMD